MKKISIRQIIKVLFSLVFILIYVSCGNFSGNGNGQNEEPLIPVEEVEYKGKLYNVSPNQEPSVDNAGPLKIAIASKNPFKGLLNEAFAREQADRDIMSLIGSNILGINENYEFTDGGAVGELELISGKHPKVIIKIKEGIKWSDGHPFTIDDVIFAYEVILHKDFNGNKDAYYGERALGNIVGADEYWEGKTKIVKGIKKKNARTVEISLKKIPAGIYNTVNPSILRFALPKHYLKDVPLKDMVNSEKIRKNIVTLGPYVPTEVIPGGGIVARANEHYMHGKPKIEKITIDVVLPKTAYDGMKNGLYDIAIGLGTRGQSLENRKWKNIYILGNMAPSFYDLVFNFGYWDNTKKENIMLPNSKMGDKRLRQALAYALDIEKRLNDTKAKRVYAYNYEPANTLIPPIVKRYHNNTIQGYKYNPEKAKSLLDEAGYKDINGDGIREDKNGQPFEIKMSYVENRDIFTDRPIDPKDLIIGHFVEMWRKVGIKTTLVAIPEKEYNDNVNSNNKEIDIFTSSFTLGISGDFNPHFFYGKGSSYNTSRYVSEEMEKLLENTVSERSQKDLGYKIQAYKEWQKYYMEELPTIPIYYYQEVILVNKRVKNFYIFSDMKRNSLYLTELTATQPYK